MEERRSDTAETFGDQDLPGDASDQNREEPPMPSRDSEPDADRQRPDRSRQDESG